MYPDVTWRGLAVCRQGWQAGWQCAVRPDAGVWSAMCNVAGLRTQRGPRSTQDRPSELGGSQPDNDICVHSVTMGGMSQPFALCYNYEIEIDEILLFSTF